MTKSKLTKLNYKHYTWVQVILLHPLEMKLLPSPGLNVQFQRESQGEYMHARTRQVSIRPSISVLPMFNRPPLASLLAVPTLCRIPLLARSVSVNKPRWSSNWRRGEMHSHISITLVTCPPVLTILCSHSAATSSSDSIPMQSQLRPCSGPRSLPLQLKRKQLKWLGSRKARKASTATRKQQAWNMMKPASCQELGKVQDIAASSCGHCV